MTFNLCPSWNGPLATWPARHASYRMPAMYEPHDPAPEWLCHLTREAAKASGAPVEWVKQTLAVVKAARLDDLNVAQAISLFDVLFAKAGRTREAVAEADPVVETATVSIPNDRPLAA